MGSLCKIFSAFLVAFLCNFLVLGIPFFPSETCSVEDTLDSKISFQYHQNLIERQETQLKTLEFLVEQLRESISRVETACSESSRALNSVLKSRGYGAENLEINKAQALSMEVQPNHRDDSETQSSEVNIGRYKGMSSSVTKYKPSWQEKFQFLSAVKLESVVTCMNVLPFDEPGGTSKYVAVGDNKGKVYILLTNGDVLAEFDTTSSAYVTSMVSYMQFQRNEGVVVTGHSDGSILMHKIWEVSKVGGSSNGEEWPYLSIEHLQTLIRPGPDVDPSDPSADESSAVVLLEIHQIGRIRYILGSNEKGRMKVFRENGSLYGTAKSSSRPLAFFRQRLLFLTRNGAGSLDLRNMVIRESGCDGLNDSLVTNYVFDVSERSKAYGFTAEGDFVHVVLMGDILNFKCRVRMKKKSDIHETMGVHAIKGYLLAVNSQKASVYNISSQAYTRASHIRPIFSADLDQIVSSFSNSQLSFEDFGSRPSVTGNREKLVVLSLGSGYIGIYRSNLPVLMAEFSTVLWAGPVLLFLLFLVVLWQFFGKKKEALTLWGSDDTFAIGSNATGTETGTSLGGGVADRTYEDASRVDVRELRDSFRGQPRRYGSPSQYQAGHTFPGGNGIPLRSLSASSLAAAEPPPFRSASELNYRGAKAEATGFHQRREPLFANNNVGEETIH